MLGVGVFDAIRIAISSAASIIRPAYCHYPQGGFQKDTGGTLDFRQVRSTPRSAHVNFCRIKMDVYLRKLVLTETTVRTGTLPGENPTSAIPKQAAPMKAVRILPYAPV